MDYIVVNKTADFIIKFCIQRVCCDLSYRFPTVNKSRRSTMVLFEKSSGMIIADIVQGTQVIKFPKFSSFYWRIPDVEVQSLASATIEPEPKLSASPAPPILVKMPKLPSLTTQSVLTRPKSPSPTPPILVKMPKTSRPPQVSTRRPKSRSPTLPILVKIPTSSPRAPQILSTRRKSPSSAPPILLKQSKSLATGKREIEKSYKRMHSPSHRVSVKLKSVTNGGFRRFQTQTSKKPQPIIPMALPAPTTKIPKRIIVPDPVLPTKNTPDRNAAGLFSARSELRTLFQMKSTKSSELREVNPPAKKRSPTPTDTTPDSDLEPEGESFLNSTAEASALEDSDYELDLFAGEDDFS